jgi:hypothetical protein
VETEGFDHLWGAAKATPHIRVPDMARCHSLPRRTHMPTKPKTEDEKEEKALLSIYA